MLKKSMVLLCTLGVAAGLAGCSGGDAASQTEDASSAPAIEQASESSAESAEEPAASEPEPEPAAASDPAGGIDPAFKEAMDEYESFMDGYVDFMAKYLDSDDVLAMAVDYAKWMADYADMAEKFEAVDDGSLNDAELAYYLEVSSRVNAKLATVATA